MWSHSVVSNSLQPHGLQHARPLCPSLSPSSHPLNRWCHLTISSSVTLFSSCPRSFPASESFPMSWLFASGGQSIGVTASVLPMNIQSWFPLGLTGLTSLLSKRLKNLLQHHSLKASVLQHSVFIVQVSNPYMTTGKTIALTKQLYWQSNVCAF